MNSRKIGDEAEEFVARSLIEAGYVTEIHPRTFRIIHLKDGKTIQISQDNDYHGSFDVKAERADHMLYVQVKFLGDNTKTRDEKRKIDKLYPFLFDYQKIQIWYVRKEWVSEPRRHKEFRYKILERRDIAEEKKGSFHTFTWNWIEIPPSISFSSSNSSFTNDTQSMPSNKTSKEKDPPQIVSKLKGNKNKPAGKSDKEGK